MKRSNKVVGNYLYNTLYQVLLLIAPLITTPYVSRVLGPTGQGIYGYAQANAAYFVLVGAVGTTLYGQREIAYVQDDRARRTEVFWQVETFRMLTVLVFTAVFFFVFGLHGRYPEVYRVLVLEVFAAAFDITWLFMGMENFRTVVVRNLIIKLCGVVSIFLFVRSPTDVVAYTACLTLPVFLGNASLWLSLGKYVDGWRASFVPGIRQRLRPIFVLFAPQIAVDVYLVLDKTMIGLLSSGIDQVGYYTQAQKIVKIVLMVVTSLGTVMLPAMSASFARGDMDHIRASIAKTFRFTFMISCALLAGLCAVAGPFVPFFFGDGYVPVVALMRVISPILVIIGASNVIGKQFLLPTRQQKAYTLSVVSGALVNFCLNLLLIPRFDAIGASVATVLAELSVTGVQCWYVRDQLPLGRYFGYLLRYVPLAAVMGVVVWEAGRFLQQGLAGLAVQVVIGIAVYALELVFTRDELLPMVVSLLHRK